MKDEEKSTEQLIEELKETRERADFLQAILDGCADMIQVVTPEGRCTFTSQAVEQIFGATVEEAADINPGDRYPPEELSRMAEIVMGLYNSPIGTSQTVRFRARHMDGHFVPVEVSVSNQLRPPLNGVVGVCRAITDTAQMAVAWQDVDEALAAIFNCVPEAIFVHDSEGGIIRLNERALEMFGITRTPEPLTRKAHHYYGIPSTGEAPEDLWQDVLSGTDRVGEWQVTRRSDGKVFDAEFMFSRIRLQESECVLAVVRDVTDRKRAEEQLRRSLQEKEALLRAVHHRVKNNFAVVSSLLRLQTRRAKDKGLSDMLKEADFRVRCMGMVHEKLHQSESLSELRIRDYLVSLIDNILDYQGATAGRIRLKKEIEEVSLGVDTAVPVGFITSELCSNCFKHAFPEGRAGEIIVSLRSLGEAELELTVQDNGIGIPEDIDIDNLDSLGLKLVNTFVKQIRGDLQISNHTGTRFRVRFRGA